MRKHFHTILAGIIMSLAAASASAGNPWPHTINKYMNRQGAGCLVVHVNYTDHYAFQRGVGRWVQIQGTPTSDFRYDIYERCANKSSGAGRWMGNGWIRLGYDGEWIL